MIASNSRVSRRQFVQVSRERDVILNHFAVARRARLLQREPDLER